MYAYNTVTVHSKLWQWLMDKFHIHIIYLSLSVASEPENHTRSVAVPQIERGEKRKLTDHAETSKSSGLFQKPQWNMKEHLVRHGSKHKIEVHTTKRNKWQQKQKQNRTHFQNKKRETRERSLTKTKARGKNENRWVQQTYTLTYTDTRLHIPRCKHVFKHSIIVTYFFWFNFWGPLLDILVS